MKDLTKLQALQTTCELLAAAVTLREATKAVPVNVAECRHVAGWLQTHSRASLDMPRVTFSAQPGPITADDIATASQQLADGLLVCRDELRKEVSDAVKVFAIFADASLRIEQLHANVAAVFRARAA
jgi:hypothetical protein